MTKHPTRLLMAFITSLALAGTAWAGDGISTETATDGRTVFVNTSDTPHSTASNPTEPRLEGAGQQVRYVYWSNTQHRWKPVPAQSMVARRARSAAAEVLAAEGQPSDAASGGGTGAASTPEQLDHAIEMAAARNNVDPDLVRAVIKVESNFNPRAVSRKGAMGLMQLMPQTARSLNVGNPFDPTENIEAGVRHLRKLLDSFGGDVPMSLAAYNAGARAVQTHNGIPPYRETQNYVRQITLMYKNGNLSGVPGAVPVRVMRDAEGHLLFSNTY